MAADGSVLVCPQENSSLSGVSSRFSLAWEDRESDLSRLERYGRMNKQDGGVMFYRTNLLIHSRRVEAGVREIAPLVKKHYPELDDTMAMFMARHHDDHELRLGDISLQLKLKMNGSERFLLEKDEEAAARYMARRYPRRVGGYKLLDLWLHTIHKDCPEAQVVSVVDKKDGFCEALHEVLAGNLVFLEPVINYLTKTFNKLSENYPLIRGIFSDNDNPFAMPVCELYDFFQGGRWRPQPHTVETIARETSIPMYESWKKLTIKEFGIGPLIDQTERY
jgi:hypothetical protein